MPDASAGPVKKLLKSRSFWEWTTSSHRSRPSFTKSDSNTISTPGASLSNVFQEELDASSDTNEMLFTPISTPRHSPQHHAPSPHAKRSKFRFPSVPALFRRLGNKSKPLARKPEFSGEECLDIVQSTDQLSLGEGDEGFGEQMTVVKSRSHQGSSTSESLKPCSNGPESRSASALPTSSRTTHSKSLMAFAKNSGRRRSFPIDTVIPSDASTESSRSCRRRRSKSSDHLRNAKESDRSRQKKAQVRPSLEIRRYDAGNHPENRNERPISSMHYSQAGWNPRRPDPFYSPDVYPFRHRVRPLWQLLLIKRFLAALKRATEEEMEQRSDPGSLSPTLPNPRQLTAGREVELGEAYCSSSTNDPLPFSTAPDPFCIPRTVHSPSPTFSSTLQARPWPPPMPPLHLRRGIRRPSCMNPKRCPYTPPSELGAVDVSTDDEIVPRPATPISEDDDVPLGILQNELNRDNLPLPLLKHLHPNPSPPPVCTFTSTRTISSSRSIPRDRPRGICWDTLSTTSSRVSNRTLVNVETLGSNQYSGTRRDYQSYLKTTDARANSPRPSQSNSPYRSNRRRSLQPLVTF